VRLEASREQNMPLLAPPPSPTGQRSQGCGPQHAARSAGEPRRREGMEIEEDGSRKGAVASMKVDAPAMEWEVGELVHLHRQRRS
jgi:hypothetical protein